MKISVSFTLWLLLGAASPSESTDYQQSFPQDIYIALREMTASLVQLKADVTTLQREFLQTQGTLMKPSLETTAVFHQQAAQLKTEVHILNQQLQVRQVAFSASLGAGAGPTTLGPLPTATTLIYKHVITNTGKAYNSNTGVFTAPVKGVYHFEWTIGAYGDGSHGSGAWLVKNTENVFMAYEYQKAGFMSSSKGATLLLEEGDVVSVHLVANNLVYDNVSHPNTFSGHLLFPI
ncbi:collagen alpha-1(VIII) chain-like isoform X1 [Perca fluviatilis]|uniref:collagen alpha-1(VIII) chain-like isoform X1 n=1 Tax=Perca fluviatilis TaxID=8168 RepID=UPI001965A72D|nr:collagen alpha-1(VIII) chain-like isoform X1 [Perca fluviatilis]